MCGCEAGGWGAGWLRTAVGGAGPALGAATVKLIRSYFIIAGESRFTADIVLLHKIMRTLIIICTTKY